MKLRKRWQVRMRMKSGAIDLWISFHDLKTYAETSAKDLNDLAHHNAKPYEPAYEYYVCKS